MFIKLFLKSIEKNDGNCGNDFPNISKNLIFLRNLKPFPTPYQFNPFRTRRVSCATRRKAYNRNIKFINMLKIN